MWGISMGMIDRYKKRGGFVQLIQLLETMGGGKREQFLKAIADESPNWEAAIKTRMLSLDRMMTWSTSTLMEFVPQITPMVMACAIYPMTPEQKAIFLNALSFSERRKVDEILNGHAPNPGEVASSQMKLISEVRNKISLGKMKFEKFDPELAIPEDVEEKLKSGDFIAIALDQGPEGEVIKPGYVPTREEMTVLRRKIVSLTQENSTLLRENRDLKDRWEAIKLAVQKIA
jgi:hypothetical protein